MEFVSFFGRVLFASVFILSAWQEFNEFGVDGGPAAKSLGPKFNVFQKHVSTNTGLQLAPDLEMKNLIGVSIGMKAFGGLLFIFGSSLGAHILLVHQAIATPILCDFYNYEMDTKEFTQLFMKFTQSLVSLGALFFFIGMNSALQRRHLRGKALKTKTY